MTAGPVERAGTGLVSANDTHRIGPLTFPLTNPSLLDAADIRAPLQRLLTEPGFGARARSIQAEIAALPGPREVVALLEDLLAGRWPEDQTTEAAS